MARWAYTLTAFVALAAWVGAQGPAPDAPLSPDDQVRLLRANNTLIGNLVGSSVDLAREEYVEVRAEKCRQAALALANAIKDAAARQDAERVAELTALFSDVFHDGLLPALERGEGTVPPQSPAAKVLRKTREDAANDLADLRSTIASPGKVGENARVKAALQKLDGRAKR